MGDDSVPEHIILPLKSDYKTKGFYRGTFYINSNLRVITMNKLYRIMATKGFSLDDELRAYEGAVAPIVKNEISDARDDPAEYNLLEEQSTEANSERDLLQSRITDALRKVTKKIGSPPYSRRPNIVPLSQLPVGMREELGHFMYSAGELPEETE